ncbi:MAG: hypothetical protein Q9M43_05735 [Sulfurimonas sp.]|nr:hypothetical protein [Sulfurimonas sp.]
MTFFELLKEYFFSIMLLVFSPYILYYISRIYKLGKAKQEEALNPYLNRKTVEEEKLGIIIENSDPKNIKKNGSTR